MWSRNKELDMKLNSNILVFCLESMNFNPSSDPFVFSVVPVGD
jgi:hypothetical protein